MKSLYDLLGAPVPFDPCSRFTTSWLLPPLALASLRFTFSLYCFATIIIILATDTATAVEQSFSYFTNLTYWGLAFYFFVTGVHTVVYACTGRTWLNDWPRALQVLHVAYNTTILVFPPIVTIVFWSILFKPPFWPEPLIRWSNISQHAMNSLFALTELVLTRTNPPPILHILTCCVILALYLAVAYITRDTEGFYTYPFLDPADGIGKRAGYIVGILIAAIIIFGLVWVLVWSRRWITETKLGMKGKFAKSDSRGQGEDIGFGGQTAPRDFDEEIVEK